VSLDVPPFTMVTERDEIVGLNVVGLRRRGLPRVTIEELKKAFREVNVPVGNMREIAAAALASGTYASDEARRYLEFFGAGKRSIARAHRGGPVAGSDG
jgi:UDP-N-acetylglucosamine acyltransferase